MLFGLVVANYTKYISGRDCRSNFKRPSIYRSAFSHITAPLFDPVFHRFSYFRDGIKYQCLKTTKQYNGRPDGVFVNSSDFPFTDNVFKCTVVNLICHSTKGELLRIKSSFLFIFKLLRTLKEPT